MKKIFLSIVVSTLILQAEVIDITPPNFKNMENYKSNVKVAPDNTEKKTIVQNSTNQSTEKKPTENKETENKAGNNAENVVSSSVIDQNSVTKNSQAIPETTKKINTTYEKTIHSDIISGADMKDFDQCSLLVKSIYETAYEKGYEKGSVNNKIEIESMLLKMKPYLDDIFMIKQYYIEDILEPPFITFDNSSEILDGGKRFVKKEGEYTIVKPAKFKKPLIWEDFLLTGFLKEPEYKFDYVFNINKKCEAKDELIKEHFLNGYEYSRKESIVLYQERLKKLKDYMLKMNLYQRLYLSKKILPPVITPMVTPIKSEGETLLISEEQYVIVKEAMFNPMYKNWLNFIVEDNNNRTVNKRK